MHFRFLQADNKTHAQLGKFKKKAYKLKPLKKLSDIGAIPLTKGGGTWVKTFTLIAETSSSST